MDHDKFQKLVKQLYSTVSELETMFPGRHFTPDGHMVGSLGECLVADAFGLELLTASNKGFDAIVLNCTPNCPLLQHFALKINPSSA